MVINIWKWDRLPRLLFQLTEFILKHEETVPYFTYPTQWPKSKVEALSPCRHQATISDKMPIYSQYPEQSVRTRTQHFLQSLGNTGRGKSPFCMWQTAKGIRHHTTLEMPINIKAARHCLAIEQKAIGYPPKLCETDLIIFAY